VQAERRSDALESLPGAPVFGQLFGVLEQQRHVFFHTFWESDGYLDVDGARRFLALSLTRPENDRHIGTALSELTPSTTVRDFLGRLFPGEAVGPASLEALLTAPPSLARRPEPHRRLWLRFHTRLRRELLHRLSTDAAPEARLALNDFAQATLAPVPDGGAIDLSVPWSMLPRRWRMRTSSWQFPNGVSLLHALQAEARRRRISLTCFASLPRHALHPDGNLTVALRGVDDIRAHAPGLLGGLQFGDALRDEDSDPHPRGLCNSVADRIGRIFHFAAERQWRVRFDGFALANRGRQYEPLARAIERYEGEPLVAVFNHSDRLDASWIDLALRHGARSGGPLVLEPEHSPYLSSLLGEASPRDVSDVPSAAASRLAVIPTTRGAALGRSRASRELAAPSESCGEVLFRSGQEDGRAPDRGGKSTDKA
jgi:hypothetical protein